MEHTNVTRVPNIGDEFEGGHYGGVIRILGKLHSVVWAPKALGEAKLAWLPKYKSVDGAKSCSDSSANTQALVQAGSPLGLWAAGLEINGHKDWCIPARDVLELGLRHFKPTTEDISTSYRDGENPSSVPAGYAYAIEPVVQTSVIAFQEGGPEAFTDAWHWSSTQSSDISAWCQNFGYGSQCYYDKKAELRVRAVRLIPINP